ncbi:molybdopterin molybdotransferase MoeA [Intestinimonas massiliensis (ex Afouda et al. 2020)]|uniref:molybdopterin molybdotransferase MoeA n=1 Tax=Intestinimonas massiliensis (ex Afouda et al. 2020) TaxID=1673721 RepID=UPI00102FBCF8|nr:gephyrin-like molybdotransferase Glp [Intestinimonas massiliensis (ex Afouda et al. 2020)]
MVTGISLEEAVARMTAPLSPLGTETLSLEQALGRTLAADVTAPLDQPPFDRSPLDGYALRSADLAGADKEHPAMLQVVGILYAGDEANVSVGPGQAVRIMTGAMLPPGCDCVVPQEQTDRGEPVKVFVSLKPYQNYVYQGEDYRAGTPLLKAGARLDAAALGMLASAGLTEAEVRRRPKVGLLTTGDEVVDPGTPLPAGKIYGSNQILLAARLTELGFETETAHQGDDPAAVAAAMKQLLKSCDVLISTGGVSVGDKDIFHQALPLLGAEQVFWRVDLKPGTPAMYSVYEDKPILSLSGNPFAAFTTFELLARPLLAALAGEEGPRWGEGVLDTPFPKASPKRRFIRGRYENGHITLPEGHSSGLLSSLVGCNCLAELPAGSPPAGAGQKVRILLL